MRRATIPDLFVQPTVAVEELRAMRDREAWPRARRRSEKRVGDNHPRSGGKAPTMRLVVRGLELLEELAGERLRRGIVLHSGRQCVSLGRDLHALPIESLWRIRARNKRT